MIVPSPVAARGRRAGALSAGILGSLKRSAQRAGAPCRMMAVPVLCVYGKSDSICPQLSAAGIARQQIGKGHHFSGEYAALADRILAFARSARP